jgi:hypothetical protein
MTSPMVPWPEIEPENLGKSFRQQITEWNEVTGAMNRYYNNECCYFADDADARVAYWEARCRLAVEALQKYAANSRVGLTGSIALEAIGSLPNDDAKGAT